MAPQELIDDLSAIDPATAAPVAAAALASLNVGKYTPEYCDGLDWSNYNELMPRELYEAKPLVESKLEPTYRVSFREGTQIFEYQVRAATPAAAKVKVATKVADAFGITARRANWSSFYRDLSTHGQPIKGYANICVPSAA